MIKAFEEASGKVIPYNIVQRRSGDVAECYCNCKLANHELQWKAKKSLKDMCKFELVSYCRVVLSFGYLICVIIPILNISSNSIRAHT